MDGCLGGWAVYLPDVNYSEGVVAGLCVERVYGWV